MVRCKMVCHSKSSTSDDNDLFYLSFTPVTAGSEENEKFFKYTPAGQFDLQVVNKAAADQIECGKEYYIDISPAE